MDPQEESTSAFARHFYTGLATPCALWQRVEMRGQNLPQSFVVVQTRWTGNGCLKHHACKSVNAYDLPVCRGTLCRYFNVFHKLTNGVQVSSERANTLEGLIVVFLSIRPRPAWTLGPWPVTKDGRQKLKTLVRGRWQNDWLWRLVLH